MNLTTAAAAAPAAAAGAVDCAALKKARDAVNGDNGSFDSYSAEAKAIANDANVTATEIGKVAPAAAAAYKTQVDAALQAAGNDGARLNDFLTGTGVTLGSIGNSTGVHAQVATSCPKPRGDGDRALRPTGPDRTLP